MRVKDWGAELQDIQPGKSPQKIRALYSGNDAQHRVIECLKCARVQLIEVDAMLAHLAASYKMDSLPAYIEVLSDRQKSD